MNYVVRIEPEAEADLRAAFEWYEEQVTGLGYEFLISVETVLSRLERSPDMYKKIDERMHRARVKRFPFGLFYEIQTEKVHVIAALHARRDPDGWNERVEKWLKNK